MALTIGSHADVTILNVVIEQENPDASWVCIQLPDNGSGTPVDYWIPANDPRIAIKQILPVSWPPIEGDLWSVLGSSPVVEAFVVGDGTGRFYFVQAANVRDAYAGNETLPVTTDQALAAYGSALVLLYRRPA
jgi:hypothetical protein